MIITIISHDLLVLIIDQMAPKQKYSMASGNTA